MIDRTAKISPEAEIDDDVDIGPYSFVEGRVRVGKGTRIGASVYIHSGTTIGARCTIYHNVVIGTPPQHFAFKGEESFVVIGDDVTIREMVTIHRATGEGQKTVVGDGSYLMVGAHVGHNCVVGRKVILSNLVGLAGYVHVGDGVVMGGMAGVHQFVRIGEHVMVGGLTKVVKDIPPYLLVDGHPAKIYGLNVIGLKRSGFNLQDREIIKKAYRLIYKSREKLLDAVADVESQYADVIYVKKIAEFFRGSKRGILRWKME